jgi:hypothetical protein
VIYKNGFEGCFGGIFDKAWLICSDSSGITESPVCKLQTGFFA